MANSGYPLAVAWARFDNTGAKTGQHVGSVVVLNDGLFQILFQPGHFSSPPAVLVTVEGIGGIGRCVSVSENSVIVATGSISDVKTPVGTRKNGLTGNASVVAIGVGDGEGSNDVAMAWGTVGVTSQFYADSSGGSRAASGGGTGAPGSGPTTVALTPDLFDGAPAVCATGQVHVDGTQAPDVTKGVQAFRFSTVTNVDATKFDLEWTGKDPVQVAFVAVGKAKANAPTTVPQMAAAVVVYDNSEGADHDYYRKVGGAGVVGEVRRAPYPVVQFNPPFLQKPAVLANVAYCGTSVVPSQLVNSISYTFTDQSNGGAPGSDDKTNDWNSATSSVTGTRAVFRDPTQSDGDLISINVAWTPEATMVDSCDTDYALLQTGLWGSADTIKGLTTAVSRDGTSDKLFQPCSFAVVALR